LSLVYRKTILRKIDNGLYVVTTQVKDHLSARTVSFLTQTSIQPPLLAMALRVGSDLYETLQQSQQGAIHFPGKDQQQVVASFFRKPVVDGQTLNGYRYTITARGNPLLATFPMALEVEVVEKVSKGDHHLFLCEVVATHLRSDEPTLQVADTGWHYGG